MHPRTGHFLGRQKDYFAGAGASATVIVSGLSVSQCSCPGIAKQTLGCRQDADLAADAMVLGEPSGI